MSDRCTMRATKAALLLLAFLSASPTVRLTAQDYRAQALRIVKTVPLIDGHNDIHDAIRARYLTVTGRRRLAWASASTDTVRRGLMGLGRDVVAEVNRVGIAVAASLADDAAVADALHTTRAPVMFSHSSARALTGHAL